MLRLVASCCLVGVLLVQSGCSGKPSRLEVPKIDAGAGKAAIEKYDRNGDGLLDDEELEACPPMKASLARIDLDGDRKIDASEVDARIAAWRDSKVGLMPVIIRLSRGGTPITDADVTLVPEAFLGENIKAARGKTNEHGMAVMQISSDPDERGVHPGFYRVEVSKKPDGTETISGRYNEETQLGVEVEPMSPESRDISFSLSS